MNCEECCNNLTPENAGCPKEETFVIKKSKRKRIFLIVVFSILTIAGAAAACTAVFMPGFFAPKNLGIKTSVDAYERALLKLGGVEPDGSLQKIKTSLTSEELSSFLKYSQTSNDKLKMVQVRINADNTMEFSATLNKEYFLKNIAGTVPGNQNSSQVSPILKALPGSVNVYAKISGEIEDNKAMNLSLSDVEIMGIGLPSSLCNTTAVSQNLENFLAVTNAKTGSSYQSIKAENEELQIEGVLAASKNQVASIK